MSIDLFKKQAERLVKFMGDKHRMRLKSASALEAVAAIHDARDWNTLAAGTNAPAAEPMRPAADKVLTWIDGAPDITVAANDWARHTIVTGASLAISAWMGAQWDYCQSRKQQGLFFFDSASLYKPLLARLQGENVVVVRCHDCADPATLLPHLESGGSLIVFYRGEISNPAEWMGLVTALALTRMRSPNRSAAAELVIGVSEATPLLPYGLAPIAAQGRSFGVVLLAGIEDRALLQQTTAGQSLLANSCTTLHLDGIDEDDLQAIIKALRQATCVAVGQSTTSWSRKTPTLFK
jgi:hypothetical protein